jgi:hypothetical protein
MFDFKGHFIGLTRRDRIKTLLDLHQWVSEQKDSAALDILMMRLIELYDARVSDEDLAADRVWAGLTAIAATTLYKNMIALVANKEGSVIIATN